jgi:hypothetical protein
MAQKEGSFIAGLIGGFGKTMLDEKRRKEDNAVKVAQIIYDNPDVDQQSRDEALDKLLTIGGLSPKGKQAAQFHQAKGMIGGIGKIAGGIEGAAKKITGLGGQKQEGQTGGASQNPEEVPSRPAVSQEPGSDAALAQGRDFQRSMQYPTVPTRGGAQQGSPGKPPVANVSAGSGSGASTVPHRPHMLTAEERQQETDTAEQHKQQVQNQGKSSYDEIQRQNQVKWDNEDYATWDKRAVDLGLTGRDRAEYAGSSGQKLPTQSSYNLQKTWVQKPGTDEPEIAFVDPRNPHGYTDSDGNPLPDGTKAVATPSQQKLYGAIQGYYYEARAEGLDDGDARKKAGQMFMLYQGQQLGKLEQGIAIDQALSGISAGPAFNVPGGIKSPAGKDLTGKSPEAPKGSPNASAAGKTDPAIKPPATTRAGQSGKAAPLSTSQTPTRPNEITKLTEADQKDVLVYIGSLLGTLPGGGGKAGTVRTRAGLDALQKATGVDAMTLSANLAQDKATAKQLGETVQRAGAIQRLNNTLQLHGEVLKGVAQTVIQSGSPALNQPLRNLDRLAEGSPELKRFQIALNAVQREYAYLTAGGAQSRAMLPVTVTSNMDKMFSPDSTLAEVFASIDQVKIEAGKETDAMKQTQQDLINTLKSGIVGQAVSGTAKQPAGDTVPTRPGTGATYKMNATGPGGHKIGSNDGVNWFDSQTGQAIKK